MITLDEITASPENISKIKAWKGDANLCDLIMANQMHMNDEDAVKWVQANSNDSNQFFRGIYINEIGEERSKQLIGIARLMFIDYTSKNTEVGLYIGDASFYGKNVGKAALEILVDEAFNNRKLYKIFARIKESNIKSIKLFEKIGFQKEGILSNHYYSSLKSEHEDIFYYTLYNKY